MRSLFVGFLYFVCLMPAYSQESLPTDADLKTAYCMGILESQIASIENHVKVYPESLESSKEWLRQPNSDLHRLRSYLAPRASQLDLTALVAAKNRGVVDYMTSKKHTMMCLEKCPLDKAATKPTIEKWSQCVLNCNEDDAAAVREQSCKNINWLPF